MAEHIPTFADDDALPPLPVPPLKHTLAKLLRSLEPLGTAEELAAVSAKAADFAGSELGARLQAGLEARARTIASGNWLDAWWLQQAYLRWPDPLPDSSNYYLAFDRSAVPLCLLGRQLACAAWLIDGLRAVYGQLVSQTWPRDFAKDEHGARRVMAMDQYIRLFGTLRLPGAAGDSLVNVGTPAPMVVVLALGHAYSLRIEQASAGVDALASALAWIVRDARARGPAGCAASLGALTGEARPVWAHWRARLLRDARNRAVFEAIETCMAVVSLDCSASAPPRSLGEAARACALGDPTQACFDKTLVFHVFSDGQFGMNGEHAPSDAICTAMVFNAIVERPVPRELALGSPEAAPASAGLAAHVPVFMDAEAAAASERALARFQKFCARADIDVLHFRTFGHERLKRLGVSPDTFIQMAMQLAHWRLHARMAPTYETGQTRLFRRGRTETVRSCTTEAAAMVRLMDDKRATHAQRRAAFDAACAAHLKLMREACAGRGCDRHLLGLRVLAAEWGEPEPALLSDALVARSMRFRMSSSNTNPAAAVRMGGFTPVCPDGYGICYCTQPDSIVVALSSWRDCADTVAAAEFGAALADALELLASLVESTNAIKSRL